MTGLIEYNSHRGSEYREYQISKQITSKQIVKIIKYNQKKKKNQITET